jgi:DNA (cytosine-5)-methyltransferase 1
MEERRFRYISLFSGVEAATVAWHPLGWEPVAFAEFDKFPSAVLAHHYPDVPNVGDVTKHDWKQYEGEVELVVGGSPCQSFSVAGKRLGMDDPRGNLALEYLRVIRDVKPRWFLYENVPGLLSSGGGRDFGTFLKEVEELGYGWSYRILDARHFGVPQRRRRVFVVGCAGGDRDRAGAVLLEPESLRGDPASGAEAQQDTPEGSRSGSESESGLHDGSADSGRLNEILEQVVYSMTPTSSGKNWKTEIVDDSQTITTDPAPTGNQGGMVVYENHAQDSRVKEVEIVPCLKARAGTGGGNLPLVQESPQGVDLFNQTLTGDIHVPLRTAGGHGAPAVAEPIAFHATQDPISNKEYFPTMGTGNSGGTASLGVAEETIYGIPGNWIGRKPENGGNATAPMVDTSPCLTRTDRHAVGPVEEVVAPTLTAANNPSRSPQSTEVTSQVEAVHKATMTVRKLTPLECERLQGFPDNYTQIPWRGKDAEHCPDGHRYKAMGNSMAVPVMNWIAARIDALDRIE